MKQNIKCITGRRPPKVEFDPFDVNRSRGNTQGVGNEQQLLSMQIQLMAEIRNELRRGNRLEIAKMSKFKGDWAFITLIGGTNQSIYANDTDQEVVVFLEVIRTSYQNKYAGISKHKSPQYRNSILLYARTGDSADVILQPGDQLNGNVFGMAGTQVAVDEASLQIRYSVSRLADF